MGAIKIVKKSIARGWNVTGWIGAKQIKNNTLLIKDLAKNAFIVESNEPSHSKESFGQAMRRFNMSEADLQKRIKMATQLIIFCGLLSIPMAGYTIYIFMSHLYLSGFVCLMLTFLLLSYAFREHFNRFQMLQRRLGCTFQDWFTNTFKINLPGKKK